MFPGAQYDPDDDGSEPAAELLGRAPSAGPWQTPPQRGESSSAYFARLIEQDRLEDAVRFAAVSLGPRRGVWWGSLCVWDRIRTLGLDANGAEAAAVDAAVEWVIEQTDRSRLEARERSDRVGSGTPWGALAMAPFWSGGSISLPDCPVVPPPAGLAEKIVANAVLKAAADPAAPIRRQRMMQSLRLAAEVQTGMTSYAAVKRADA